jgi:hypothetical protein
MVLRPRSACEGIEWDVFFESAELSGYSDCAKEK